MTVAPMHPVDVLLILTNADHVLLALRDGTGYADGHWNLPSGKLEQGEDALSAVIREAREEIGVQLGSDAPRMVATVHHRCAARLARVGLVFAVAYDAPQHGERSMPSHANAPRSDGSRPTCCRPRHTRTRQRACALSATANHSG